MKTDLTRLGQFKSTAVDLYNSTRSSTAQTEVSEGCVPRLPNTSSPNLMANWQIGCNRKVNLLDCFVSELFLEWEGS